MKAHVIVFSLVIYATGILNTFGQNSLTLTLSNTNPSNPLQFFDGFVFRVGGLIGDASTYASFSGNGGNRSFQIDSPGEGLTRTHTGDGFFNIRPVTNMTINGSLIKNFNGVSIGGSNSVTIKDLTLNTNGVSPNNGPVNSNITVTYQTNGAGTIPVGVSFKAQIFVNGNWQDLPNSTTIYPNTTREDFGFSKGEPRLITGNIPNNLAAGIYSIRVVSTGANITILSSAVNFSVQAPTIISISTTSVNSVSVCPGRDPISVSFGIDNGTGVTTPLTGSVTYAVQLSNSDGSFPNNPLVIGSGTSSPIICDFTSTKNSEPGNYRVRVIPTSNTNVYKASGNSIGIIFNRTPKPNYTPISYCQNATIPLQSQVQGENLFWYAVKLNGTEITPQNSATPPSSPTNPGLYEFQVTQTINGCQSSWVFVPVTVNATPAAPGDVTREYCRGASVGQLSAGNGQNLVWFNNNGSQLSQAPIPDTGTLGTQTFKVAYNVNGCRSSQSTVSIKVNDLPKPPTVSNPEAICQGQAVPKIVSLAQSNDQLRWYDEAGNPATNNMPAPSNSQTSRWLVASTNGTCESSRQTILVTVKLTPPSPQLTTEINNICQNSGNIILTATGNDLTWRDSNNQDSKNAPVIQTSSTGTTTYRVHQTQDGCTSNETIATITVKPRPSSPIAVTSSPVCQFGNAHTLTATPSTGGTLRWYTAATGVAGQSDQAPQLETQTSGSQTFFVSQVVNGCESETRALITQQINKAPELPVISDLIDLLRCSDENPRSVSATALAGHSLKWYNFSTGNQVLPDPSRALPAAPSPTKNVGITNFYVTQTDGNGCQSLQQVVSVTVNASPTKPIVSDNQYVCQFGKNKTLQAQGSNGSSSGLFWTGDGILTPTASAPEPPTGVAKVFSYQVYQQIGTCKGPDAAVSFSVIARPTAPPVQNPAPACIGSPSFTLQATALASHTLKWYDTENDAANQTNSRSSITVSTAAALNKNWYVSQQNTYGCESPYAAQAVRVLTGAGARMSGDGSITGNDSTAIRIYLSGDAPWSFTLTGDQGFSRSYSRITESPVVCWVCPTGNCAGSRPLSSSALNAGTVTYSVRNLQNECGLTPTSSLPVYRLAVQLITGTDPGRLSIRVLPNPATSYVQLQQDGGMVRKVGLRVVSLRGEEIWSGGMQSGDCQLDVRLWPAGFYIIQVLDGPTTLQQIRFMKL